MPPYVTQQSIPPRLRLMARQRAADPVAYLRDVLASSETYEDAAFKLTVSIGTLYRWRKQLLEDGHALDECG